MDKYRPTRDKQFFPKNMKKQADRRAAFFSKQNTKMAQKYAENHHNKHTEEDKS